MNKQQALDAVRNLLGLHSKEVDRYYDIDRLVNTPSDEELVARYDIDQGSKNYSKQLRIARQSFNPTLQLLLDSYSQSLKVENHFRGNTEGDSREVSDLWTHWQRNRMDARQTGLHHAALKYGLSYTLVLPGNIAPVPQLGGEPMRGAIIDTFNPKKMVTAYGERWSMEEYPILALQIMDHGFRLYDEEFVYFFGVNHKPLTPRGWLESYYLHEDNIKFIEKRAHNVGVTPVVRYRDRVMTDGEETHGIVENLTGISERINSMNFEEGISRHWAAFKQRYIIGWAPKSMEDALRQRASDTWTFEDPKNAVSVGQFDETDLKQYTESRRNTIQDFASLGQLSATSLGAQAISNVSAEGLDALERAKDSKTSEVKTSLGESHEQTFRLCGHVSGDVAGSSDFDAECKWMDDSPQTTAQKVDALVKMAQGLGVPVTELWSEVPGWTSQKVDRVRAAREEELLWNPNDEFASPTPSPQQPVEDDPEAA